MQTVTIPALEGDVQAIQIDASAWAADNSAVTTATWSIVSGSASVSSTSVASSVASALITTSAIGPSLIKCSLTDGTHTKVVYVKVRASKPFASITDDYGLCA